MESDLTRSPSLRPLEPRNGTIINPDIFKKVPHDLPLSAEFGLDCLVCAECGSGLACFLARAFFLPELGCVNDAGDARCYEAVNRGVVVRGDVDGGGGGG